MSTSPYSIDLREKVINFLAKGEQQKLAAKIFGLHSNTVNRWWNRYKKEGTFLARRRLGAKRKLKLEELTNFVDQHPDCKLASLAKRFNITEAWASIMLRKIGYSYKKNRLPMWKRTKRNELNT